MYAGDIRHTRAGECAGREVKDNSRLKALIDECITDKTKKKMPRRTPEMYDGEPRETWCNVRLKLERE